MGYYLEINEPIPIGIKRFFLEQTDQIIASLNDNKADLDEAVHNARKCMKKIRALLRLVRKGIDPAVHKRENAYYRDISRHLSELRDSAVKIETLKDFIKAWIHEFLRNEDLFNK
jgi:hypothetical protein